MSIIGEGALSAEDRRVLTFTDEFETTFLGQGTANRSIQETLDLAWKLLRAMPVALLKRIPQQYLDQYYTG